MTADPDVDFLLDILAGKARVQAVSTAAALGIPDLLAREPRTAAQLAEHVERDADAIDRLVRFLVALGICEAVDDERFALTRRGHVLCEGALGPLAAFAGAPEQWDPWSRLRTAMRNGADGAFAQAMGSPVYEYLAHQPEAAARYDRAIDAFTRHEAQAICRAFDFASLHSIVDVGGGSGTLLLEILEAHPHLQGTLYDLPHVAERAQPRLAERLGARATCAGGDFMHAVPEGHDGYLLKHVLHNWDDATSVGLLRRCADAMSDGGCVLVVDAILTPDHRFDMARLLDLEMLVLTEGRERRKPEMRKLFHEAELELRAVEPLVPGLWLLVGVR